MRKKVSIAPEAVMAHDLISRGDSSNEEYFMMFAARIAFLD